MNSTVLLAAAFGEDPGRWPLPPACSAQDLWLRAVAAAGQGRYSNARTDLATLHQMRPGTPLASLAFSARASFLRQVGWHRLARGWDGQALALAGQARSDQALEARSDALVGLAADALGIGRLAASAAFLERAKAVAPEEAPARLDIRLAWVSAELAMAGGDGATAVRHARRGVELAQQSPSRRHIVKSDVVHAAALCCAGSLDQSRTVADAALAETLNYGLVPLRWALASLLAGIGSVAYEQHVVLAIREQSSDFVTRHGGQWSGGDRATAANGVAANAP